MSAPLRIRSEVLRRLTEQADRWAPRECCGLLAGGAEGVELDVSLTNISKDPSRCYFAEPRELIEALRSLRREGRRLLGIYHSHPHSSPEPSPADITQAFYPDCATVIIGPPGAQPRVRAFRIVGGRVTSLGLEPVEKGHR